MGDHICLWWLAYIFDNPFRHSFHNPEKMLGSCVAKGMTILDIGCELGFFSMGLQNSSEIRVVQLMSNQRC